jgi:hypothetical protein
MAPPIRGPATRHKTTKRKVNVIASQKSWLSNVSVRNGGKPAPFWGWVVPVVVACSFTA